VNQSPTIGALAAALSKAQTSFTPAVKDAANPFYKSKYLTLAGALDAVRSALGANGLALVQAVDATGDKLTLNTTLLHSSGEWIGSTYPINPVKNDPQGIGSAVSYGRRYSLMALLGIAAEDDDGEAAHGRTAKVDVTTGEVKKAQPKWTDEQRTEVGSWFNAIVQGVEGGDKIVQDFRKKYQYTDPAKVIEMAKELAKEHAVEP
jgi:hypothetical protein